MTNSVPKEMLSMGEPRAISARESRELLRAEFVDVGFLPFGRS